MFAEIIWTNGLNPDAKPARRHLQSAAKQSDSGQRAKPTAQPNGTRPGDTPGRDNLHERFEVKRNSYLEAYGLDGACTDMAEGCFSRLRRAEVNIDPSKVLVKDGGSAQAETALGMISQFPRRRL